MISAEPDLFKRFLTSTLALALTDNPAVMVIGPRQVGKTTLVRQFTAANRTYVTLDDDTVLQAARSDPSGFVRGFDLVTIDEIQRAPELLRAVKQSIDTDRRSGRFLLTGSANILALPQVSESLAGRMEIIKLLPISRTEIRAEQSTFISMAFAGKLPRPDTALTGDDLVQAVLIGGYPEMLRRQTGRRRQAWARDYISAIVQRDVRDIADVENLSELPRLLHILAHHSGQLTNFTQMGGQMGLTDKTTQRYISIFEQLFLVSRVQPWFRNQLKRLIKSPKLHFLDSGLLGAIRGLTAEQIVKDRTTFGPILETFVFAEVMKQLGWSDENHTLHHYRDKRSGRGRHHH